MVLIIKSLSIVRYTNNCGCILIVGNGPRGHYLLKIQPQLLVYLTIDNDLIIKTICYSLNISLFGWLKRCI